MLTRRAPAAFGGCENAGLQGWELCTPFRVRRVHGLIDDGGTAGCVGGECGIAGIPADNFHATGNACLS